MNSEDLVQPVAEAEVKLQLRDDNEYHQVFATLQQLAFTPLGRESLTDDYLEYARSEYGGYNFTRLRRPQGGSVLLTRKQWVLDAHGEAVRMEEEREIDEASASRLLHEHPGALRLQKERVTLTGVIPPYQATVVLDRLCLRGADYYFLECEVLTSRDAAQQTRQQLLQWARATLPITAVEEAPSMLEWLLRLG